MCTKTTYQKIRELKEWLKNNKGHHNQNQVYNNIQNLKNEHRARIKRIAGQSNTVA